MNARVRIAPYYYVRVEGDPDQAYRRLAEAASDEVDLQAFSAVDGHEILPIDGQIIPH